MFRKLLDEARAGDNVGLLLRGTKKDDVERGMVIAKPGSIKPHKKFKAEIYVLSKEEGGRHTPFFSNYRPQFYFRTTDVTGSVKLPEGVEMVMPGDNVSIEVELITPVAMEKTMRFAIREGGKTVGAGRIAEIVDVAGCQVNQSLPNFARGGCFSPPRVFGSKVTYGSSSIGRVAVSKTACWGFESLLACSPPRHSPTRDDRTQQKISSAKSKSNCQKASWPWEPKEKGVKKYKELIDSTLIVVIAMLLLGGYVAGWDFILNLIMGFLFKAPARLISRHDRRRKTQAVVCRPCPRRTGKQGA